MDQHIEATPAEKRVRFSVPLNLRLVEEILRRMKVDGRSLGDWVEYGLHLALGDTMQEGKPAVSEQIPVKRPSGNSEIALAFAGFEALLKDEELRDKQRGVKPRPGSYRGA